MVPGAEGQRRHMRGGLSDETWEWLGDVGVAWGLDWARVLTQSLVEGDMVDMGYVDLFAACPNHRGRNIANHPCEICGHEQAHLRDCREMVTRWEPIEERPGQLNLDPHAQLEMEL